MFAAVRSLLEVHPHVIHCVAHLPEDFAANFARQDLTLASYVATFYFFDAVGVGRRRAKNSTLIQVFHDHL